MYTCCVTVSCPQGHTLSFSSRVPALWYFPQRVAMDPRMPQGVMFLYHYDAPMQYQWVTHQCSSGGSCLLSWGVSIRYGTHDAWIRPWRIAHKGTNQWACQPKTLLVHYMTLNGCPVCISDHGMLISPQQWSEAAITQIEISYKCPVHSKTTTTFYSKLCRPHMHTITPDSYGS